MDGTQLAAVALIITSIGGLITSIGAVFSIIRSQRVIVDKVDHVDAKVGQVHEEVKTANGISLAALADRTEGRRVEADISAEHRTESEQGYVDMLGAGGRDMGHDGRTKAETKADIKDADLGPGHVVEPPPDK